MVEATAAPVAARLGRRALLSTLISAPLVVACFVHFGVTWDGLLGAYFCTALVLLSIIDFEERRLPNVIVLPSFGLVLTAHLVLYPERAAEWTIAAVGAALFLFLPTLLMPGAMGMGDFKLALLLGGMLGWAVVTALFVGAIAGALVAIGVLIVRGSSARKQMIAFGPFLAFGGVVALFVGQLPSL
jgi:leader peptidase (prepilin peptidase) / N-methyltransferase